MVEGVGLRMKTDLLMGLVCYLDMVCLAEYVIEEFMGHKCTGVIEEMVPLIYIRWVRVAYKSVEVVIP